ncbi:MAG: hypothetical protein DWQ02_02860 [Bacteroidetes bacterium]|nr:MAG: hypothetical protein DWQ02_02860 [Bacteroidota bacterium]
MNSASTKSQLGFISSEEIEKMKKYIVMGSKTIYLLFLLLFIQMNSFAQQKEISITRFTYQVNLSDSADYLKNIHGIRVVNLENQRSFSLPDQENGKFIVPNQIAEGDILLEFQDETNRNHSYFIPWFEKRALIGLNRDGNKDCMSYIYYNACDALAQGNQYGIDCDHFNFILLDYCKNSSVIIYPGMRRFFKYVDYQQYLDSLYEKRFTNKEKLSDSGEISTVCGGFAKIKEETGLFKSVSFYSGQNKRVLYDTLGADSIFQIFYDNGQLFFQVPYRNGLQNGWYEQYHENGVAWAKDLRINGKTVDGFYQTFHDNGNVNQEGYMRNGNQVGKWYVYTEDGKPFKVYIYNRNGDQTKQKNWNHEKGKWQKSGLY